MTKKIDPDDTIPDEAYFDTLAELESLVPPTVTRPDLPSRRVLASKGAERLDDPEPH